MITMLRNRRTSTITARVSEQLLDSVRDSELRELAYGDIALATTVKTDSGEQILTVFVPDQSATSGHLVGYLHLLDSDPSKNEKAVNAWFASMKPGTRVYICGHDVSVDFYPTCGTIWHRRHPERCSLLFETSCKRIAL